ncbi:antitoxin of toxin-antitoxin stability system [Castellaniella sp.]|uniref:antitoxin of toxin-antitoxin stability system n=1 Tax=Castellaniella sp. TaxID=1955812 RepID=UPI00355E7423
MSTKAVFTMKLEPELRDEFMAATAEDDRPASQVVRELMRDYIKQRRQAREYDDYLRRKVEAARRQRDAGLHFSNEEVEAEAAARRVELLRRIGGEAGL